MTIVPLAAEHVDGLQRFLAELPEGDVTFIKEDVGPDAVAAWVHGRGRRWVALNEVRVVGIVAVLPLSGWSDHVGEIRLVVHPDHRGAGIGRALARRRAGVGRGDVHRAWVRRRGTPARPHPRSVRETA
jgi:GNAT superfamily N-acetyltransferase